MRHLFKRLEHWSDVHEFRTLRQRSHKLSYIREGKDIEVV